VKIQGRRDAVGRDFRHHGERYDRIDNAALRTTHFKETGRPVGNLGLLAALKEHKCNRTWIWWNTVRAAG
jgi:hypothetical protein